jgi:hypothetical protein
MRTSKGCWGPFLTDACRLKSALQQNEFCVTHSIVILWWGLGSIIY